jgi:hypothetical protein
LIDFHTWEPLPPSRRIPLKGRINVLPWLAGVPSRCHGANRPLVPQFDPAGYPPSGVLPAPPPAPVAVPSSGVLEAPLERQTITTTSVKLAPSPRSAGVAHTRMARHFVLRRTAAPNPMKHKREDAARNATSVRATTAHETTTTQHVIVVTAATVPTTVGPRYFNYAAPATPSRSSARALSANSASARSSAPLIDIAIAVRPRPMPIYRYVYETDRILVIDPRTGIAVQAIPR